MSIDLERRNDLEISHIVRYLLAASYLKDGDKVLDVFCGSGYGSKFLAKGNGVQVTAFDRFNNHAKFPRCTFITAEYPNIILPDPFDMVVCFEAIEHVDADMAVSLTHSLRSWTKKGGQLFISSPNEKHYPYTPSITHHFKHYTPIELEALLGSAGFQVTHWWNQKAKFNSQLDEGPEGRYMIARAV